VCLVSSAVASPGFGVTGWHTCCSRIRNAGWVTVKLWNTKWTEKYVLVRRGGHVPQCPIAADASVHVFSFHFHFEPVNSLTVNLYEYQLLCAALYVQLKAARLDMYIYMLMHLLISAIAWSTNSRNGWISTWFIKLCNMSIWHYSCWSLLELQNCTLFSFEIFTLS